MTIFEIYAWDPYKELARDYRFDENGEIVQTTYPTKHTGEYSRRRGVRIVTAGEAFWWYMFETYGLESIDNFKVCPDDYVDECALFRMTPNEMLEVV